MIRGSTRATSARAKQPRRLAFGHGETKLELRSGPLEDELRALAAEGVQSLLLEGGPTLATAFLAAGLVDKLMLFVAPVVAGDGPRFIARAAVEVKGMRARQVGDDVLLEGYLRER